jgi:hypothetical protein
MCTEGTSMQGQLHLSGTLHAGRLVMHMKSDMLAMQWSQQSAIICNSCQSSTALLKWQTSAA